MLFSLYEKLLKTTRMQTGHPEIRKNIKFNFITILVEQNNTGFLSICPALWCFPTKQEVLSTQIWSWSFTIRRRTFVIISFYIDHRMLFLLTVFHKKKCYNKVYINILKPIFNIQSTKNENFLTHHYTICGNHFVSNYWEFFRIISYLNNVNQFENY